MNQIVKRAVYRVVVRIQGQLEVEAFQVVAADETSAMSRALLVLQERGVQEVVSLGCTRSLQIPPKDVVSWVTQDVSTDRTEQILAKLRHARGWLNKKTDDLTGDAYVDGFNASARVLSLMLDSLLADMSK